jgi:serine/threonine protein kinase
VSKIGKGSYGTVWKTKVTTLKRYNQLVGVDLYLACKILSLSKFSKKTVGQALEHLLKESEIHCSLKHENIVQMENIFYIFDKISNFPKPIHVLMFTELCNGDLKKI